MPIYQNSEQLYECLKDLFQRVQERGPEATREVTDSRLIIRLRCTSPSADVVINGRRNPFQITYGTSPLRPDLDAQMPADALHRILTKELPLGKALASGQMKVRGPLMKTFALEGILHSGQDLYPQVLREHGLDGYQGSEKETGSG